MIAAITQRRSAWSGRQWVELASSENSPGPCHERMSVAVDAYALVRYIDEYEDRYHRQHTTPTGNRALRESGTEDGCAETY